jgi:UDP-N-acetylmuramate--alanine ligase
VGIGSDMNYSARVVGIEQGCYRGQISHNGVDLGVMSLAVSGEHNLQNAVMAVAACAACGVAPAKSMAALAKFSGVDRRMSVVGSINGATVVDDYGHHPTEIRATLAALRGQYKPRKLYCVFQPHQHSRTRFLLEDFASSFQQADTTIVPDIYFVRDSEAERQKVSAEDLVSRLQANGRLAIHLANFGDIVSHLKKVVGEGDLVVTMGAGNVWQIGKELAGGRSEKAKL